MSTLSCLRFLASALPVICIVSGPSLAITKVFSQGELSLVRDSKESQYGALKVLAIEAEKATMVYRWFLLPEGVFDLGSPLVHSGTVEVAQVQGRAVVSFGPFVMEWHATGGDKGMLSANGNLGVQPLLMASSAIHDATRIKDVRSGFRYEEMTTREIPDRLGLSESFAKLPKARLGIGVADTFADVGLGVKEKAVQVVRIDENSNAYQAGLRTGHCVLTFNGVDVLSAQDLHNLLQELKPEETVIMTVYTGEDYREITFAAGSRVTRPEARPTPTPDPNLSPEDRARVEGNQEMRRLMDETLEALKAVYYD